MTFLDDLRQAEATAAGVRPCLACEYLASMDEGPERAALRDALAGTIGIRTLATILREHDIPIGRRVIISHRKHLEETS